LVDALQSQARWDPPQGNVQLMTEQHILSLQPPARFEQVGNTDRDGAQNRKHQLS
jgi:hypothetical protein